MTQVAELLTLFLDLFAADSIGSDDTDDVVAQGLAQYMCQVESIAATAEANGDMGLYHVCDHYHQLLEPLAGSTALSEDVRLVLEEWPTLVMVYLDTPTDPDTCLALVEHLQNPTWPTPISAADAETLLHLLVPSTEVTLIPAPAVEAPTVLSTLLDDLQATDLGTDEDEMMPQASLANVDITLAVAVSEAPLGLILPADTAEELAPAARLDALETCDTTATCDALASTVPAEFDTSALVVEDTPLLEAESTCTPPAADLAPETAMDETVAEASETTMESVAEAADLTDDDWAEADARDAREEQPESSDVLWTLHTDAPPEDEEWTDEAAMPEAASEIDDDWAEEEALDAATQNLLELLCQEATQLASALEETLTDAAVATGDWRQALLDHSEELERFGEGAAAMGLAGLQQVSTYLYANLLQFSTQEEPLSAAQRQIIQGWPAPVLHYLQGLYDPATHTALIAYLDDARWPEALTAEDRSTLLALLPHAQLAIEDDEPLPGRPREAQLADISLSLPEDVVPELLDALLQELPGHAADFSAAIQRLAAGQGSLADVTVAQRIAHSLKGAANTVGVAGVANLTHHLEDILLAFSQHNALPTPPLRRTLTNAADCLEAMSEALSGAGTLPPVVETLTTLQAVLDWANLIDEEGVPSDETVQPPERETLPGLVEGDLSATAEPVEMSARTSAATPGTRLGTDLVDSLLRLSGENMILNGQLQDRLKRTVEQTRTIRAQNSIVQQLVWELEQLVDIRGVSSPLLQRTTDGEFDPLEMEQYNELHTVSRRLLEAVTDALAVGNEVESSLVALDGLINDQRRVQRESNEAILQTRMVPVKTIAPRLQRGLRQACRLTGKDAELLLTGGDTLLDNHVLTNMLDPLMHMLRNAVDHGIEAPEEREACGKSRTGTIALAITREGNTVVVRCRDDGAGLDYEAIRHTALERGLITAQDELTEEEMGRLILRPGFSTRAQATQISGRGIGMDVVYTRIQELKGSLRLSSEAGQGCLIEVRLPVSLMSTHGLLVRSGTQRFAIADLGVEQILYSTTGAVRQDGDTMVYQWGTESLEATTLEALLNLPVLGTVEQLAARPALLVRDAVGHRRVVLVQAVLDSLPLVIKPLGRYVPTIPGVAGATILGDGSATPVLDLPDLFRVAGRGEITMGALQETVRLAERTLPIALVVDDSLSARRALADFVQDLGFEVHTAGDGLEAIASMERQRPAILLVDLEMPRMNGLELAEHVRVRHTAEDLPIIMITSRSTEKHRHTATRSGVNAYLVKPFPEDLLAEQIQQLLAAKNTASAA